MQVISSYQQDVNIPWTPLGLESSKSSKSSELPKEPNGSESPESVKESKESEPAKESKSPKSSELVRESKSSELAKGSESL